MITKIISLIKSRIYIATAAGLIAYSGALALFMYDKGHDDCEQKTITRVINIREAANEIRNSRPDDTGIIERLHNGKF